MVVDEVLQKQTGYVPPGQQQQQQAQQGQAQTGTPIDPFLSTEKSDLEFWIQVLQLIVLIMILREVSR